MTSSGVFGPAATPTDLTLMRFVAAAVTSSWLPARIALTRASYSSATKSGSYSNYQHRTRIGGVADRLRGRKEIGGTYWDATFLLVDAVRAALGLDVVKATIVVHVGLEGVHASHAQMAVRGDKSSGRDWCRHCLCQQRFHTTEPPSLTGNIYS